MPPQGNEAVPHKNVCVGQAFDPDVRPVSLTYLRSRCCAMPGSTTEGSAVECAVPFYSCECGGPIVDLTGRAIGVTIARVGPHGGMVIQGDCVQKSLPDLQSGRLAGNWAQVRARAE
jgi:hypothetical protein